MAQAARYYADSYRWIADIDVADVSGGSGFEEVIGWLARWISDGTFLGRVRTALADLPSPIVPGTGLAPLLINLRPAPGKSRTQGAGIPKTCS